MRLIKKEKLLQKYNRWDIEVEGFHNFLAEGVVVHNSHLMLIWDAKDDEIKLAKRTSIIEDGENFYGCLSVKEKYEKSFRNLIEFLKETKSCLNIIIHGEIFGGTYPGRKTEGAVKVQSGIFYCDWNDFYAFDLRCDGNYLDVDEANNLFQKFGFFFAKTIFEGSLQECINYKNDFNDPICTWLGLPEVENNITEGIVIRPKMVKKDNSGERIILKSKNSKWSEKQHHPKVKTEIVLSDEGKILHEEILSYLNENRLSSVLSKLGPIQQNEFGKLMGEMSSDLWKDALKDHKDAWEAIEKEEQKKISKIVGQEVAGLIRKHFQAIIDGRF